MNKQQIVLTIAVLACSASAHADWGRGRGHDTRAEAQVDALAGKVNPAFTIGETVRGYTPPGILDGTAVWSRSGSVQMLVNHEMGNDLGYPYTLDNGVALTGARVSSFWFDPNKRGIIDAGLAYGAIYNRAGEKVDEPSDLEGDGLGRLCSARGVARGERGFMNDIFFTGEGPETARSGRSMFAEAFFGLHQRSVGPPGKPSQQWKPVIPRRSG